MPPLRRSGAALGFALAIVLAGGLLRVFEPPLPPILGHASVVDGDTLRLGGERVRLLGIDAPERQQTCADASGADWACGEAARRYLAGLLAVGDIACQPQGRDRYGRLLAHCRQGEDDLSQHVVRAGLAIANGEYFADASMAQSARAGIWAGSFMAPAEWRREHGEAGGDDGLWGTIRRWFR